MSWSAGAKTVWGKSDPDDSTRWLPLVQHLCDAMEMSAFLWDQWAPEAIKKQIETALPEGHRDGRALVRWLAGIHDIGKASPPFASKVGWLGERMAAYDAPIAAHLGPTDQRLARHAALGQVVLEAWWVDRGAKRAIAATYASVVGAHHGQTPTPTELVRIGQRPDWLGAAGWHAVRVEILDEMAHRSGAEQHVDAWATRRLPEQAQMLLTALVIVADWMASDTDRFPLTTQITDGRARAEAAWAAYDLPPPWRAEEAGDTGKLLADRFPALAGHPPRPIQRLVHGLAQRTHGPAMLIVEAPMGVGKTEAGLLAAEALAARFGLGGVFVGLPTMATSDAMFDRVVDWIDRTPAEGAASTFLAHSKAAHNESWQGLLDGTLAGVYDETEGLDRAVAVAVSWLSGRKKGMLASFVVGTIDQALFMALCAKHVMLRHLALAGKVVVIDEVHAADDYMRVYLTRALSWLAAYGVPVVLLSATLPSRIRHQLVEAYAGPLGAEAPTSEPPEAYPLVTVVDRDGVNVHSVPGDPAPQTTVGFRVIGEDPTALTGLLRQRLAEGGCVAVIRNTVARAQQTYRALAAEYGSDVVLFHSRFLAPDRAAREARLRRLLGPDGQHRPHRLIVVGTQVLEQSLDVDFDLMVTDIAPVDLVLQRLGRLHRHRREVRPECLRRPDLLVTGVEEWGEDGPRFAPGLTAVYPEATLLRSLSSLGLTRSEEARELSLPAAIRPLVETAYAPVTDAPAGWQDRLAAADRAWAEQVQQAVERAQGYLVPDLPRWPGSLVTLLQSWGEPHEEDRRGAPQVRDGEDALEVIVVHLRDGEVRTMPGEHPCDDVALPLFGPPDWPVAKRMAAMTVRLPFAMCAPWQIESTLAALEGKGSADWQTSPWLSGRLVLTLDEEDRAQVAGFDVEYSGELGLIHAQGEADD